jgi:hypothetical protein
MPLESATYLSQLNTANPANTDALSDADDHMRLIKAAVKNTFPNFTAAALTSTQAQLQSAVANAVTGPFVTPTAGTTANPGVAYSGDPNTGWRSSAADVQRATCGATDIVEIASTGLNILAGTLKIAGTNAFPLTTANLGDAQVTTIKIADANVTLAKMANIATASLLGRTTASTGVPEVLSVGSSLVASGGSLNASLASQAEAEAGTDATKLMTSQRVKQADAFRSRLFHVRDEKSSGTNGQVGGSAGTWTIRNLNTSVTNEITGASVGSNQITLPAGTYFIEASGPAWGCNTHRLKLYNVTDSTDVILGTSEYSQNGSGDVTLSRSWVRGRFTIAGTKVFELRHFATRASANFGEAVTTGQNEVYTEALIWRTV